MATIGEMQSAQICTSRCATLGLGDTASQDEGSMRPTGLAPAELTPAEEAGVAARLERTLGGARAA